MWDSIYFFINWVESYIFVVGLGLFWQVLWYRGLNVMIVCIKSIYLCFFFEFMYGCKNLNRS